jgi:hypothetical protein
MTQLEEMEGSMAVRQLSILGALLLSGCAATGFNLKSTDIAEVEQNWEAHAVRFSDPKELRRLTLVGVRMDFRWMATGIGYYSRDGYLLRRDAWKGIVFFSDGTFREFSAVMGEGCVNISALFPDTGPEKLGGAEMLILSGGNDKKSKSVLTTDGTIVGPLARKAKDQADIDLAKLRSDTRYRKQFFAEHPSRIRSGQIIIADPGTEIGDRFIASVVRRFPVLGKSDGRRYSRQAELAAGETNQVTTMDKVFSNVHMTIGPGIAAWPVGPGLTLASFVIASVYAADMPLHGSFEGGRFGQLEIIDTLGACHESLAKRLKPQ